MLTSHDLFLFSKWGRSLLADSVAEKALDHLPSWFTFSSLLEILGSFIRCWSRNHQLSPSFFPWSWASNFNRTPFVFHALLLSWAYHSELSMSGIPFASLFSRIPPLGVGRSCAILAQLPLAPFLGFLGCHPLLKSLAQAFFGPPFLPKAQSLLFSFHGQGSPFSSFLRTKPFFPISTGWASPFF